MFIKGIAANLNEKKWMGVPLEWGLCPILRASPSGLYLVMPRCTPVSHIGLYWSELYSLTMRGPLADEFYMSDAKPENFGYLHGRFVKLDYGS